MIRCLPSLPIVKVFGIEKKRKKVHALEWNGKNQSLCTCGNTKYNLRNSFNGKVSEKCGNWALLLATHEKNDI